MKSFLATLVLASVSLSETTCDPIPLYRKRSKEPVNGVLYDHIVVTNKIENDTYYELERQIATICTNQVNGTLPFYTGYNPNTKLHFAGIDVNEANLTSYYNKENPLGYIYVQPQDNGFIVSRLVDSNNWDKYFVTDNSNEWLGQGHVHDRHIFYSLPLASAIYPPDIADDGANTSSNQDAAGEGATTTSSSTEETAVVGTTNPNSEGDTPLTDAFKNECMPVNLYRMKSLNIQNRIDRIDTIHSSREGLGFNLEFGKIPIATICYKQAKGTVPLFRRHFEADGMHMPMLDTDRGSAMLVNSVQQDIIGYVYQEPPTNIKGTYEIYRITGPGSNNYYLHPTEVEKREGLVDLQGKLLFHSLPLSYRNNSNFEDYPDLQCNPVPLYQFCRVNPHTPGSTSYNNYNKDNPDNFLNCLETIDPKIPDDFEKRGNGPVATICSQNAPGTVALKRGFKDEFNGLYISSTSEGEIHRLGYKIGAHIGYVYSSYTEGRIPIYSNDVKANSDGPKQVNFITSAVNGGGNIIFYSSPMEDSYGKYSALDYPKTGGKGP